jgi:hypothetical protein
MHAIEFEAHVQDGAIQLPFAYQHWHEGQQVKVIVLAPDPEPSLTHRPIGLAKGLLQVPASFFEPLPGELLDAFEGKP